MRHQFLKLLFVSLLSLCIGTTPLSLEAKKSTSGKKKATVENSSSGKSKRSQSASKSQTSSKSKSSSKTSDSRSSYRHKSRNSHSGGSSSKSSGKSVEVPFSISDTVYLAGYTPDGYEIYRLHGNRATKLKYTFSKGIDVMGSYMNGPDLFSVGNDINSNSHKVYILRNGDVFSDVMVDHDNCLLKTICYSRSNMWIVGTETGNDATVWKNSIKTYSFENARGNDVFFSDTTSYVCGTKNLGHGKTRAALWVGGKELRDESFDNISGFNAVYVRNRSLYIAGYANGENGTETIVVCDGQQIALPIADTSTYPTGLYVSHKGNVYVTGIARTVAPHDEESDIPAPTTSNLVLWINGEPHDLSSLKFNAVTIMRSE